MPDPQEVRALAEDFVRAYDETHPRHVLASAYLELVEAAAEFVASAPRAFWTKEQAARLRALIPPQHAQGDER